MNSWVLIHGSRYGRVSEDEYFKLPLMKLNSRGFILSMGTLHYASGINNSNGLSLFEGIVNIDISLQILVLNYFNF